MRLQATALTSEVIKSVFMAPLFAHLDLLDRILTIDRTDGREPKFARVLAFPVQVVEL